MRYSSHMSHSHIRGPKPESQPTTSFWILVTAGVGVALLLVLIVAAKIRDGAFDTSHLTAEGKISETRIVVDHTLESMYGGRIYYRIEAHVAFEISGKNQDRWVTASEITPSREMLAAELARLPQSCQIYWTPGHSDSVKCRLHP